MNKIIIPKYIYIPNEILNITNKQIDIYTTFAKEKGLQWAQ